MATTEQKKKLLKAKIAVALHDELGRVPRKEEIDNVFLLARVMYKAVLGPPLPTANSKEKRTNGYLLTTMKVCFHEIVFCDSYGKSCGLCGIALEGYGVAAFFPGKQEDNDRCLHGATAWRKINENEEQCKYCLHIFKMNTLSCEESGRCNNLLPFSKLVFYHDF